MDLRYFNEREGKLFIDIDNASIGFKTYMKKKDLKKQFEALREKLKGGKE